VVIAIYFKSGGTISNPKHQFKSLVKDSTPITAVRTVSSIVSSIIAVIIPIRLQLFGYSSTEALSEFGIIMGMTFPIIMIPSTLISSLAVTTVPTISEQSKDIDKDGVDHITSLKNKVMFSIKSSIIFSSVLISTFITLGIPICEFLFNNSKAGVYLTFATVVMIPLGISQITSSILNAIGLEIKSLKNHVISSCLLIVSIYFLPEYFGTYALIIGYFLMATISAALNISMLKKRKLIDLSFLKTIALILIIILISATLGIFIHNLLSLPLIADIIISTIFTFGSTTILLLTFNVANFKVILFRKRFAS
jgi:stage V sporulation protein B